MTVQYPVINSTQLPMGKEKYKQSSLPKCTFPIAQHCKLSTIKLQWSQALENWL